MKGTHVAVSTSLLMLRLASTTVAQAREFWGAYAEGGEYWSGGEAYGLSWNYPSQDAAIDAAVAECMKHDTCTDHGVHKLNVFSTSASTGGSDYREPEHGYLVRARCIAIEGTGNWGARGMTTKRDSEGRNKPQSGSSRGVRRMTSST